MTHAQKIFPNTRPKEHIKIPHTEEDTAADIVILAITIHIALVDEDTIVPTMMAILMVQMALHQKVAILIIWMAGMLVRGIAPIIEDCLL